METIIVKIAPDGALNYEVRGVKGQGCKQLTKAIDDLSTVKESKATHEMFEIGGQQSQGIRQ